MGKGFNRPRFQPSVHDTIAKSRPKEGDVSRQIRYVVPYHILSYRREDKTRLLNKYHEISHLLILKLQNLWFYLISSIFNFITHTKGKLNHILLSMKKISPLPKCTKTQKNPQNCTKLKKMHKNPQKTQKIPQNKFSDYNLI